MTWPCLRWLDGWTGVFNDLSLRQTPSIQSVVASLVEVSGCAEIMVSWMMVDNRIDG